MLVLAERHARRYVAKFALDSKTIHHADRETIGSIRDLDSFSTAPDPDLRRGDEHDHQDYAVDVTSRSMLPHAAAHAPTGGHGPHATEAHARRGSVWVDAREPDEYERDTYALHDGLHHGLVDHGHKDRNRAASTVPWHERWADDEAAARQGSWRRWERSPGSEGIELASPASSRASSPASRPSPAASSSRESPDHSPIHEGSEKNWTPSAPPPPPRRLDFETEGKAPAPEKRPSAARTGRRASRK